MDETRDTAATEAPSARAWLALALLAFIYMLNFMDRQILSVLIEPIRRDIGFTDTQIGLLSGTLFAVCYSLLSVPIAIFADRSNRVRIVAASCLLWSAFTGISGLATTFAMLAVARVGVAVGEAGGVAPSLSLISDFFPPKKRMIAISLFMCCNPVGVLVGTTGGGLIAAHWGWRAGFLAAAIVGIAVAPVLLMMVREPVRGRFDAPATRERRTTFVQTLKLFVRLPSLAGLVVACIFYAALSVGFLTWMPALLIRGFGASVSDVALYYGPVVGISLIIGTLLSGMAVSRFERHSITAYALVPAAALVVCAPLLWFAFMSSDWRIMIVWLAVPIALMNFVIAPALALVQHLAPADARSTASSLLMMSMSLVGVGIGPLLIGFVSDHLAAEHGTQSLRHAMIVVLVPAAILTSLLLCFVARGLTRDRLRTGTVTF